MMYRTADGSLLECTHASQPEYRSCVAGLTSNCPSIHASNNQKTCELFTTISIINEHTLVGADCESPF